MTSAAAPARVSRAALDLLALNSHGYTQAFLDELKQHPDPRVQAIAAHEEKERADEAAHDLWCERRNEQYWEERGSW